MAMSAHPRRDTTFEALGWLAFRRRRWILTAAVGIVALSVGWGLGLFGVVVGGGFEVPDSESYRAEQRATEALGRDAADVVVLYTSPTGTVDDAALRTAVESALDSLPSESVAGTTTFWSSGAPRLLSEDGGSTYAVIELEGDSEKEREAAFTDVRPQLSAPIDGLEVRVGGPAALNADINDQVREDIARAEALSMPIMLVLLILVFGGLVAASLPLAIGALAVLGSFTMLRLISLVTDVSVFSINIVTMLGLALAIDYSLFIVSRFREEMRNTADVEQALRTTMSTAGRTVAFSGVTVAISLGSLLFFPQLFLRSMAFGGISAVLISMLGALTILPALLAVIGPRIDRLQVPLRRNRTARHRRPLPGAWERIARSVMRRPVVYVAVIVPVLLFLGAPFLGVNFGTVDHRVLPSDTESRVVAERLESGFPGGGRDPVEAVVTFDTPLADPATEAQLEVYRARLAALPDAVGAEVTAAAEDTARIHVQHAFGSQSEEAKDLLGSVRDAPAPEGASVLVGGATGELVDILASFGENLPWMALWMVCSTLVLLFLAFGSVVLPVKAAVMNALSLTATFGAVVWIFQDGNFSGLLDFTVTGWVDSAQPILILAIAFGLSMDYEVFLLSRVREEWDRTGDNTSAVAAGLQRTGGIITSAALILVIVFAAFATSGITFIKMIGVGMVLAIVIDATVVRALLVPASMQLLGRANWWAPASMASFWRRHGLREGGLPVHSEALPRPPRPPRPYAVAPQPESAEV